MNKEVKAKKKYDEDFEEFDDEETSLKEIEEENRREKLRKVATKNNNTKAKNEATVAVFLQRKEKLNNHQELNLNDEKEMFEETEKYINILMKWSGILKYFIYIFIFLGLFLCIEYISTEEIIYLNSAYTLILILPISFYILTLVIKWFAFMLYHTYNINKKNKER